MWLFSNEGIPASVAIDYLKSVAHKLGHGGCEIFPKQSQRHSADDVGNWINLPYFGDTRKARIVTETDIGYGVKDVAFDMFMKVAEHYAVENTEASIEAVVEIASKEIGAPTEKWYDGPPCLQRLVIGDPRRVKQLRDRHDKKLRDGAYESEVAEKRGAAWVEKQEALLKPQLSEGGRDVTFFNVAMYLARRELDKVEGKPNATELSKLEDLLMDTHADWVEATRESPLKRSELQRLSKQGLKDGWNYTCKQPPLKNFCDSKKCIKRDFGIGSRTDDVATPLEGFTIVTSIPPVYYFEINGKRVQTHPEDLADQRKFGLVVMRDAEFIWQPIATPKYMQMLQQLFDGAAHVDPPPENDMREIVAGHLLDYLKRNAVERGGGHDRKFKDMGKPLCKTDTGVALFKIRYFANYLETKMDKMNRAQLTHLLTRELGARDVQTTLEDQSLTRGWRVELPTLENIAG